MEQNPQASSRALIEVLNILAIPLATVIGAVVGWLLNRKKVSTEAVGIEAVAVKTRAEARKLDGETINLAWDRIDELQEINYTLRADRDEFKMRAELQMIELQLRDGQIKKLMGILDSQGIKLQDFDQHKH